MSKEPRLKLPWAGLLIILVAPLATLMVVVPSLFAGTVSKVETGVPAVINRVLPNVVPRPRLVPPVAQAPRASPGAPARTQPATAAGGTPAPGLPAAAPLTVAAAPAPAASSGPELAITAPRASAQHGRRRRRRPHQPLEPD